VLAADLPQLLDPHPLQLADVERLARGQPLVVRARGARRLGPAARRAPAAAAAVLRAAAAGGGRRVARGRRSAPRLLGDVVVVLVLVIVLVLVVEVFLVLAEVVVVLVLLLRARPTVPGAARR